ncbi:MAG: YvcK family protein [Actinobacteria bacterium]|nr:YvcK family protein [Actinomycetota bacterium]
MNPEINRQIKGDDPAIVVIGGGTGLPTLLRGLKYHTGRITAIVTVADDGGSSGRLRRELDILPPGDIRNCLVALAEDESLLGRLFQYRFAGGDLSGHSFGNLFLAALAKVTGDFEEAVRLSSSILATRGRVLPATPEDVILHAELADGRRVDGQSAIANSQQACRRIWLEPKEARATRSALEAIAAANAIILGPGSLFTSIIPNLLVKEITTAVERAGCPKIFVCNVMTQPGETLEFTAADHLAALTGHSRDHIVDIILVNSVPPPPDVVDMYLATGAGPVLVDESRLRKMGVLVAGADIGSAGDYFRHESRKLAGAIMAMLSEAKLPEA